MTAKERITKASTQANNILLDILATAKRASMHVTDPKIWSERIAMATMNPVELARKSLNITKSANKS
jgi:hypothetical protein